MQIHVCLVCYTYPHARADTTKKVKEQLRNALSVLRQSVQYLSLPLWGLTGTEITRRRTS